MTDSATIELEERSADVIERPRAALFGFELDTHTLPAAVDQLLDWMAAGEKRCRFVVTPNVDHAVMYQEHEGLRAAYRHAAMILPDGMPVVVAGRWLGRPFNHRVAGSDLVPALLAAGQERGGMRVVLLGAAPGVAARAAENITARWPAIQVVGVNSPPLGFEHNAVINDQILSQIAAADADLLIVGLGAPKQELWVDAHRHMLPVDVALCVGATIDFLAGEKRRAPLWMQHTGLEWLHRVASEPRRLAQRYARDAWLFPRLVWRQWRCDRQGTPWPLAGRDA